MGPFTLEGRLMDDRQRHQVAMGIGVALAVASYFLPRVWPKVPVEAAWIGLTVAAASFLWGVWPLFPARSRLWSRRVLPGRMIPLHDAARMAFEAIEGTVLEMTARRPASAPHGPLCFMATKLFTAGVPIYGKQVPSSRVSLVRDDFLFANEFARDATVAQDQTSHAVTFTDLTVKQRDAEAAIKVLKQTDARAD